MRIIIQPETLVNPKWYPIFDVLILLVEDKRHSFAVEGLSELMKSSWILSRPITDRDLIRLSSQLRSTDALADMSSVTIDASCKRGGEVNFAASDTCLHPLDAIAFLSLPFNVIVENEWYDGGFLLWMSKALGFTKFLQAYRERRLQFRHAGGKSAIARSAEIMSKGVWPRLDGSYSHARRLWGCVVIDSDARCPGDDQNAAIRAETEPHVAFLKELRRRSIESYLPAEIMENIDNSHEFRHRVRALFRLTETQRKHYHMKNGFRFHDNLSPDKDEYASSPYVSEGEKALYNGIPDDDWRSLRGGFGKRLSDVYVNQMPNFNDKRLKNGEDKIELMAILEDIYRRL